MTAADGPQIDIEPLTPSRLGLRPAEWLRRIRAAVLAYPRLAAGMLLAVTVLSFADLVEIIPALEPVTHHAWFPFIHATHIVLSMFLLLYIGHRVEPALGLLGVGWLLIVLAPYIVMRHREELPEIVRLLAMMGAMGFAIYLSAVRKQLQDVLHELAIRDPVTGLLNRRQFERELARQILVAERYRIPAAVVYLDLDKFKAVNDSLGHQAGDRLLIGIAEILKQNIRATDVAARLGGDEFALILTYTSLDEAKTVAERLAQAFREHHVSIGDQLVATTGSFGVVGIDRKSSVSDLMVAADLAMYAVKNRGGNGVSLVPLIA